MDIHRRTSKECLEGSREKLQIVETISIRRGTTVGLIEKYELLNDETYVDACHLCYAARLLLRDKHPDIILLILINMEKSVRRFKENAYGHLHTHSPIFELARKKRRED